MGKAFDQGVDAVAQHKGPAANVNSYELIGQIRSQSLVLPIPSSRIALSILTQIGATASSPIQSGVI